MKNEHHNKMSKFMTLKLVLLLMLICIIPTLCLSIKMDQESTSYKKTDTVRDYLTSAHGDTVKKAITDFETTWASLEMTKNPDDLLNKLVTGPLYDYYLRHPLSQGGNSYLISKKFNISKIKVLVFTGKVFKAIACEDWEYEEVDVNGKLLKQFNPTERSKFYTFIYEDGSWKLGISIDTSWPDGGRQEWEYLSDKMKDYIGEFDPPFIDCGSNSD